MADMMLQHSPARPLSRKRRANDDIQPSGFIDPSSPFASPKRMRSGGVNPELLQRLQEAHTSSLSQPPIRKLLSMLPNDQLAGIICSLVERHPQQHSEVLGLIPRPSLTTASSLLERSQKALIDAFPYHKDGPSTTSYSFHRVRPQLEELKEVLLYFLDFFVLPNAYPIEFQHEYPASSFGYLDIATTLVHRLPVWQDPAHDDVARGHLYRRLGQGWRMAVSEVARRTREGKIFGATPVAEWAKNLHKHSTEVQGQYGFNEAFIEFKASLGWAMGMDAAGQVA
ncbi:Cut8 six-helix bundle-domain-containing protein [Fimicolochytrium jonesii]|uniref:Cut8 six-helix bundle-domain-containing protein n=1 Tax=Fimicolochytrium jonesii TaxID=1396493 RepID=UPI0022FF050C|nr:Cut8 six-helix bundle-domain-containing protein [Fimicolochytrium jonesii]KAI8818254.1 Cut8 six-helix bundle-domain-containing protein [Fimicolochytrium jonesii]